MMYVCFALVAIFGYLIGSMNYSIIVSRVFMKSDIRSKGSGNAGSTNMLRNYGWSAGVITLFTDFMKTAVVTLSAWSLFREFYPDYAQTAVALSGLFCAIGHCFPLFFGFKGGKGIAVGAITILAVDYRCFIFVILAFVILVAVFRFISLGSIAGAVTFVVSLAFFTDFTDPKDIFTLAFSTVLSAMTIILHSPNIARLFKGTESKISFKKSK
ncbi:MAG: glycerol-3-phosphate acyltransferase [Clostridia bacterium]|nr:glycerol-3-phosphate acyltransferase [Clostridia bacterium]